MGRRSPPSVFATRVTEALAPLGAGDPFDKFGR